MNIWVKKVSSIYFHPPDRDKKPIHLSNPRSLSLLSSLRNRHRSDLFTTLPPKKGFTPQQQTCFVSIVKIYRDHKDNLPSFYKSNSLDKSATRPHATVRSAQFRHRSA